MKGGLSWEVGGVWGKSKRYPESCLGMKASLWVEEGGLGRLVSFYVFHVIFKMKNDSEFSYYFFKVSPLFSEHPDLSSSFHSSLYRPLSFNLPDRTGRQGIADFEKNVL